LLCIVDIEIGSTEAEKERAANELCQLFELCLPRAQREVKSLPPLYQKDKRGKYRLKYIPQPKEACAFRMPKEVDERGGGDCKQLVLRRLAELRNAGIKAMPRVMWIREVKGFRAHALIRHPDNNIEDPSVILGMKQP